MGWMGELSSMVLGRLVSGGERGFSECASEAMKLDKVDDAYKPTELSAIDQLYEPVEPCDLLSKQQTTMIYLAKTVNTQVVSSQPFLNILR